MQKWIIYACVILILNAIFNILTPNSSLKNVSGFVMNLLFISLILTPIFKNISMPKLEQYFNSGFESINHNQQSPKNIMQTNKKNLERALTLMLANNGFEGCILTVERNENKNETKILVKIPSNQKLNEKQIKNLIEKETGLVPEIVFQATNWIL